MRYAILALLAVLPMAAQEIKLPPNIEKLADKASEVVDVTLDASLLQLAARMLPDNDPDAANIKRLVSGLKGIYVRSFQFDKTGEYQMSDVEQIRAQVKAPLWSRIVGVKSHRSGENAEVFLRNENGQITGLTIIATEPKELTIVSINGPIRPEDIQQLGGHFGIPKVDSTGGKKSADTKKDED